MNQYAFNLWSDVTDDYSIVVPLGTFAYNATVNGQDVCLIAVQETHNVYATFGSMFFNQFYAQFTNDYEMESQSVMLYSNFDANVDGVSTGLFTLAETSCPFGDLCPTETSDLLWLWITLGAVGFVLIVALGVYCYKKHNPNTMGDSSADHAIVYENQDTATEQKLIDKYDESVNA